MINDHRKVFFYTSFVVLLVLGIWVVRPFLHGVMAGAVMAMILYPLYVWLQKKTHYRGLAAFVLVLFALLLIIVPTALIINQLLPEAHISYITAKQMIAKVSDPPTCNGGDTICQSIRSLFNILQEPEFEGRLKQYLDRFVDFTEDYVSDILVSLPKIILTVFISLISLFYFLRDGERLTSWFKQTVPLPKDVHVDIIKHPLKRVKRCECRRSGEGGGGKPADRGRRSPVVGGAVFPSRFCIPALNQLSPSGDCSLRAGFFDWAA